MYKKKFIFISLFIFFIIFIIINIMKLPYTLQYVAREAPTGDYFLQGSSYLNEADYNEKYSNLNPDFPLEFYVPLQRYLITLDYYSDTHILAAVYQALVTGRNITENGSYNFAEGRGLIDFRKHWENGHQKPNINEVKDMVGLYGTVYNNIGTLIYSLFPKNLRHLVTEAQKKDAAQYMTFLYILKILIHGISWTLLLYVLYIRFNLVFAWIIALAILFYPGTHRHAVLWMHSFIAMGFLPAYIIGLYPLIQTNKKLLIEVFFYSGFLFLSSTIFYFIGLIYFFFVSFPVIIISFLGLDFIYTIKHWSVQKKHRNFCLKILIRYFCMVSLLLISFFCIHMNEWHEARSTLPKLGERGEKYDELYTRYQNQLNTYFNFFDRAKTSGKQNYYSVAILRTEQKENLFDYYIFKDFKTYSKNLYYIIKNYLYYPVWSPSYYISTLLGERFSTLLLSKPGHVLFFLQHLNMLNFLFILICLFIWIYIKNPLKRLSAYIALIPLGLYSLWLFLMFHILAYLFGHLEISSLPIMPLYLIIISIIIYYFQIIFNKEVCK